MRYFNVAFALAVLAVLVFALPLTGNHRLIAAQSVSPTMPAMLG
jgi:hypothetical protein